MSHREWGDLAALTSGTAVTRFAFRSHYLYDIDSVNFALALRRFDTSVHQPHPPGYFLYICLGRLFNLLFNDANAAFTAISIAFSCATVAMIYILAGEWFGRSAAAFAGLIFLFSPLAWFHGTVALTYIAEAFFSILVGFLCWRARSGRAGLVLPAAAALGIAAGFRPSSILFLGPLFLFSLWRVGWRRIAGALGILTTAIAAWFVPMVAVSGVAAWFSALRSLWVTVPGTFSVFNSPVMNSVARAFVVAAGYLLCFGVAALLPFCRGFGEVFGKAEKRHFTTIWTLPGLVFFVFVYLRFVNLGYLMVLMPPVCLWLGCVASRKITGKFAITAGIAINSAIFIWSPFYCSWASVRRFETELRSVTAALPQVVSPGETVIVGLDSHFLGYRHAGYYLPGYLTLEYPEVRVASGRRTFAMLGRDTDAVAALEAGRLRNFVIFPLPSGDAEYTAYMAALRSRFPPGDLRVIWRDGYEFAVGPIRDLQILFPHTVTP